MAEDKLELAPKQGAEAWAHFVLTILLQSTTTMRIGLKSLIQKD